jgi:hypothetical protein
VRSIDGVGLGLQRELAQELLLRESRGRRQRTLDALGRP